MMRMMRKQEKKGMGPTVSADPGSPSPDCVWDLGQRSIFAKRYGHKEEDADAIPDKEVSPIF